MGTRTQSSNDRPGIQLHRGIGKSWFRLADEISRRVNDRKTYFTIKPLKTLHIQAPISIRQIIGKPWIKTIDDCLLDLCRGSIRKPL